MFGKISSIDELDNEITKAYKDDAEMITLLLVQSVKRHNMMLRKDQYSDSEIKEVQELMTEMGHKVMRLKYKIIKLEDIYSALKRELPTITTK